MKFLKADGTIEEGEIVNEVQITRLDRLESVLHASVCGNSYHASYDRGVRKCRRLAAKVILGTPLETVLEEEYQPEEVHPLPFPTGVEA
jgi:hypothetical protein